MIFDLICGLYHQCSAFVCDGPASTLSKTCRQSVLLLARRAVIPHYLPVDRPRCFTDEWRHDIYTVFVACPWQAVQAVQLFSTDSDEVVLFLDAMFDYHPLILDDANDDVARLELHGILAKWAVATGTISGDQFERLA